MRSKFALLRRSWICKVSGSVARNDEMSAVAGSCREWFVESRWRSQLNRTASASNGVPSENVMPGRSRSVHAVPFSRGVKASAMCGCTVPVAGSDQTSTS